MDILTLIQLIIFGIIVATILTSIGISLLGPFLTHFTWDNGLNKSLFVEYMNWRYGVQIEWGSKRIGSFPVSAYWRMYWPERRRSTGKRKTGSDDISDAGLQELLQNNQIDEAIDLYSRWHNLDRPIASIYVHRMLRNPLYSQPPVDFADVFRRPLMNWFVVRIPPERLMLKNTSAHGLANLIAEGKLDEANDLYRRFAGVDQYTAQDAVEKLRQELRQ